MQNLPEKIENKDQRTCKTSKKESTYERDVWKIEGAQRNLLVAVSIKDLETDGFLGR